MVMVMVMVMVMAQYEVGDPEGTEA
jgi:hypothetical protein